MGAMKLDAGSPRGSTVELTANAAQSDGLLAAWQPPAPSKQHRGRRRSPIPLLLLLLVGVVAAVGALCVAAPVVLKVRLAVEEPGGLQQETRSCSPSFSDPAGWQERLPSSHLQQPGVLGQVGSRRLPSPAPRSLSYPRGHFLIPRSSPSSVPRAPSHPAQESCAVPRAALLRGRGVRIAAWRPRRRGYAAALRCLPAAPEAAGMHLQVRGAATVVQCSYPVAVLCVPAQPLVEWRACAWRPYLPRPHRPSAICRKSNPGVELVVLAAAGALSRATRGWLAGRNVTVEEVEPLTYANAYNPRCVRRGS